MPSIISQRGGLASASHIALLSSPKIKEGLASEGMGSETKRESVRVCNFDGIESFGGPAQSRVEGWKDRVEVKEPDCGPSILLLPSTSGDLETCLSAADASAAP